MLRYFLLLIFSFFPVALFAQVDTLLSDFHLFTTHENIILNWTIKSGSTCNGISIQRSENDTMFTEIGKIIGDCGNLNEPVPFTFIDESPLENRINYYRLQLGTYGYTKSISTEFIKLSEGKYLIRPNPVRDHAIINFQNSTRAPVSFTLTDLMGKQVLVVENIKEEFISFNRQGLRTGVYIFTIQSNSAIKVIGRIMFY